MDFARKREFSEKSQMFTSAAAYDISVMHFLKFQRLKVQNVALLAYRFSPVCHSRLFTYFDFQRKFGEGQVYSK